MGVFKRQLKSGPKYRYQGYFAGKRYTGPTIYQTETEALQAEREYLATLQGDTLASLMRDRLEYLKVNTKSKDYLIDTENNLKIAREAWGSDTPVTQITKPMAHSLVQKLAAEWKSKGLTAHRPNHFIRILRAFFYYVIEEKGIEMANPFKKVKLVPTDGSRKYIPSDFDLFTVLGGLNAQQRKLVQFILETGCRLNEALALKAEDVTQNNVTLYTNKARNSNRTARLIPRPTCLLDSDIPVKDKDRIFSEWKERSKPEFLRVALKTTQKSIPEEERVRWGFHNLRHRAASEWAQQGMPTIEIMARLGHTNIETTMIYLQNLGFSSRTFTSTLISPAFKLAEQGIAEAEAEAVS